MIGESSAAAESEAVKTCAACGGSWPASRSHCPACGSSLANVTAQPRADTPTAEEFDWRWLDALAPEEEQGPNSRPEAQAGPSKRAWWQFWRRQ